MHTALTLFAHHAPLPALLEHGMATVTTNNAAHHCTIFVHMHGLVFLTRTVHLYFSVVATNKSSDTPFKAKDQRALGSTEQVDSLDYTNPNT